VLETGAATGELKATGGRGPGPRRGDEKEPSIQACSRASGVAVGVGRSVVVV